MSSTTRTRRPISIYDYPEHLNPFSECHLNVPDKRRIIVDKFGKNGTWSSKITKRLNRSVSWIEKSWLQVDNSPRRAYESRICNDLHNNALYARQSQVHNVPTRRESCSDVRQEFQTALPECVTNGNSMEKSKSVENLNKCDTRRRKKRPAPRPPSALRSPSVTERQIVEDPDNEKVANDECKTEESQTEISVCHENETTVEDIEDETKSINEVPIEENLQASCEEASTQIDESKLSDQIENIRIDNNDADDEEQSKPTSLEHEDASAVKNQQDEVIEGQLDENANISSTKNENESSEVARSNHKVDSLKADIEIRV